MPNFYRMQMRDDTAERTVVEQVLAQNRITAAAEYAGPEFAQLPPGTVIMVHRGNQPVALVETVERLAPGHGQEPSFGIDYQVNLLSRFDQAEQTFPMLREMRGNIVFQGAFRAVNSGNTYHYIKLWHHLIMQQANLDNYRAVLEFKHQMILQGPPGTGKTRLAKQIAAEMTKPRRQPRPLVTIDKFLKNFRVTDAVKQQRAERQKLLANFQKAFPKESLATLAPDRYAIGTGTNDTFCYWMEHKLKSLREYAPGTATAYLLYKRQGREEWVYLGSLLTNRNEAVAPMQEVAALLSKLVLERNTAETLLHLKSGFALKVLHSYYPKEYLPINEEHHLDNALKLFGEDPAERNAVEKNRRVQELFEQRCKFGADVTNDEFADFLYDTLALKKEPTIEMDELVAPGAYTLVQFHPAYSYEDFVRGIVARVSEAGQVFYETEDKTLALLAQQALDQPTANFVLVIDEINRANLPAVLGELIYALEYRYDPQEGSEAAVQGMYTSKTGGLGDGDSRAIRLPKNLYIIGTMNSADRSIGHLDYAIRRRFAFQDVLPSEEVLQEMIKDEALRGKAVTLFRQVAALFEQNYLAADYSRTQVQPGHSYFLADTEQRLGLRLRYEIQPLLHEYLKDGVLRPEAKEKIEALHV